MDVNKKYRYGLLASTMSACLFVSGCDIDDIIVIMGQPEDYADTEESYSESTYSYKRNNNS
ncbi:MAG: hypothetical protein ACPGVW_07795, partial [Pseudoalteromonas marina]